MFQWFRRSPIFLSRKVSLEQLEERIVLDAAGAAAPQDNPDQQGNQTNSSVQDETTASAAASPSSPESGGGASQPSDPVTQVFQQDLNVVLISNAMDQVEALTDAVVDGAEVIVFAAEGGLSAAVDQLASLVSSRGEKIDHLAILSHGAPGIVEVGPGHLIDPFCVIFDPAPWKELGMLLDGGARIDLYGCNIGQGPMGLFLVQAFAQVTEAAVWASDDATGNVEGADWELEVRSTDWDAGYLIVPDTLEPNAVLLAWSPNPPAGTPNADSFWNSAGGDPAIPVYGSVYTGAGDDYVQNDGSIQGDIWFGPDNDKLSNVGSYYPFGPKAMINGTVYGEDGDDEINNGNANKNCYPTIVSVYGGAGNDIIKNYGYIRHIYEDGGDDVITNYNYDPSGTVTFQSTVEYDIHGGPGNDVITNQAKSLVNGSIYGDGGVDTITNTWIVKGSIDGGTEADVLTNSGDLHGNLLGSYGNDTITNNWKVFTNIYGGEGNDIISNTKEVQFIFGDDSGSYTYCDDVITNTDTVWGAIYGQDGNDTITNNGYVSNDMSGHDGNDTIVNNWSVKWIDGGRGNDTISNTMSVYGSVYGGMGHDVITNISYVQGAIEGGEDSDTIYAGTAANPGGAIGAGINCGTGQDHVHVYSPNLGAYSGGVHIWGGEETDPYSLAWDQLNLYASVITIYGTANEGMSDWSAGGTTYHPIWAQFEQVNVHGTSGAFDFLLFGSDTYWHMLGNGASGSTGKYGTSERVNWDGYEYPIVFNSQPVLDSNPIMMPGTYMEDSGATSYMTLNQLMHLGGVNHVTDPDRLSTEFHVEGIAITGVNDDYGTWQYKDNFGSWQTVTGVSDSHALLLSSMSGLNDTEIRFLPNANWNGTLTDGLTFRAWDQVYGTTQSFVDINAAGSWTNSFSATANTIGVTVQPVNDAPEVSTPFADVTVNEDASPVTINLLGHFSDVETASANLTYTASVVYAGGLSGSYVVDNAPDLLTFDFGANGHGSAHVTVTATDTGDGSDTTLLSVSDTFQVTVNPVNDAPWLSTHFENVTVNEDPGQVSVNLRGHFSDVETAEADLTYTATVVYADGLIGAYSMDNATDVLRMNFGANTHGSAQVTVTATDTGDGSDTTLLSVSDTFQVTVNPVNDAPWLSTPLADVTVNEDADPVTVDLLGHFSDFETAQADLTYSATVVYADGLTGTCVVNNASDSLILSFDTNSHGSAQVTVIATDTGDSSDTTLKSVSDTFQVTVNPVNDAPWVSTHFADVTVNEDAAPVTVNLLGHISDVETGETNLTYTVTVVYADGLTGTHLVNNATDLLTLTFDPSSNGSVQVTVTATDSGDGSDTTLLSVSDTFQVTVIPVDDPPVALNVSSSGDEDTTFQLLEAPGWLGAFQDLADAGDGAHDDPFKMLITDTVNLHGTLTYGDGSLVGSTVAWSKLVDVHFTGDAGFNGPASFTFKVRDAGGGEDTSLNIATMSITVVAVNDAPTATVPGTQHIDTDLAHAISVRGISVDDVDLNEGTGLLQVFLSVEHGSLNLVGKTGSGVMFTGSLDEVNHALGTLAYSPSAAGYGSDAITLVVNDLGNTGSGGPLTATRTIPITISALAGSQGTSQFQGYSPLETLDSETQSLVDGQGANASIDRLLSIMEKSGLLPWAHDSSNFQVGPIVDSSGSKDLLELGLFGKGQAIQERAWDELLEIVEHGKQFGADELWLNLETFLSKMREWRLGADAEEVYLFFNCDDIDLFQWHRYFMGSDKSSKATDGYGMTDLVSSGVPSHPWKGVVFYLSDVRMTDLLNYESETGLYQGPGRNESATEQLFTQAFDLSKINFLELV